MAGNVDKPRDKTPSHDVDANDVPAAVVNELVAALLRLLAAAGVARGEQEIGSASGPVARVEVYSASATPHRI